MTSTRQLAAIMFTDIVGYTALMGSDERKTMELVRKNKEVQKPLVEQHKGTWLKELGDGTISSFSTALDAVSCAIDIQKALNNDPDLKLRIGIHLGDIMLEDGDVYGDGVNIASRLQSIAESGGIYISDSVQKAIRGNSDIQYALLGELELKNVDYPVKTYALRGEFLPRPKETEEKHLSGRLFAELQRRNVPRASLAYLAFAFIVFSLSKFISLSPSLLNIIYGLLILGVPVSIYLAWNYENSPEGFVKVTSRKAWVNPYSDTQKKPFTGNGVIIFLLIIIAGFVAYPQLQKDKIGSSHISDINDKSIAVLPFENMSNDPDQEYFSNGMTEDILNYLAKIKDLRVKSRTSTLQYKGTTKTIPEIGAELAVSYVLEGSVRKAGNQVRITAQLINSKTDEHIWSESYDREISEIFAIQTEVAKEIVRILEIKLAPSVEEVSAVAGTSDITAYDYYLRARDNAGSDESAIELLKQAIALDPGFAEAYAQLSAVLYWGNWGNSSEIYFDSALALANKAIEINPESPGGYIMRGTILGRSIGDQDQQGRDLQKAYELEPNNPDVLNTLGWYLIMNDDPEQGGPMVLKSFDLDLNRKDPEYYRAYGQIYRFAREFDKARDLFLQASKLAPDWNAPKADLGWLSRLQGDYQQALKYYLETGQLDNTAWNYFLNGDLDQAEETWLKFIEEEKDLDDSNSYVPVRHRLGMLYSKKGEKEKAKHLFDEQIKLNQRDLDQSNVPLWQRSIGTTLYDLAVTKAFTGETEDALKLLERPDCFWGDLSWYPYFLETDPMLESIRDEPRFQAVYKKWKDKADKMSIVFRKLLMEKEANEQMKLQLDK